MATIKAIATGLIQVLTVGHAVQLLTLSAMNAGTRWLHRLELRQSLLNTLKIFCDSLLRNHVYQTGSCTNRYVHTALVSTTLARIFSSCARKLPVLLNPIHRPIPDN